MLNPDAPEFEYEKSIQRCCNPSFSSLGFSYSMDALAFPQPLPSIHPFIQIQRPVIYNSFMTYFPRLPERPSFLAPSPVAVNSSEDTSCKGGPELSPEHPASMEEIPFKVFEPKVERTVSGRYRRFRGAASSFSRCLQKKALMWKAKGESEVSEVDKRTARASPISSFEFDLSASGEEKRTTVMIRNIPNRYSRTMLLELLDRHCSEENQKVLLDSKPILSEYDFLYLLMDFRNRCNLGYAFVNFTTPVAAIRLHKRLHGLKWQVFDSKKTCEIFYARIQGRDALEAHFHDKLFRCGSADYLPIRFSPARNGSTSLPSPQLLGRRRDGRVSPSK